MPDCNSPKEILKDVLIILVIMATCGAVVFLYMTCPTVMLSIFGVCVVLTVYYVFDDVLVPPTIKTLSFIFATIITVIAIPFLAIATLLLFLSSEELE